MIRLGKLALSALLMAALALPATASAADFGRRGAARGAGPAAGGGFSAPRGGFGGRGGIAVAPNRAGPTGAFNRGPGGTFARGAFRGSRAFNPGSFRGDIGTWRRGNWYHGWHGGTFGWWWTFGPSWYWYDYPVYPYPAYPVYAPGPYYDDNYVPQEELGPAPQQFWYYCDNPQGYYPYVTSCNGEWRQVPTRPDDAPDDNGPPPDDSVPPPPDR